MSVSVRELVEMIETNGVQKQQEKIGKLFIVFTNCGLKIVGTRNFVN